MKTKLSEEFIRTQLRCPDGRGRVEYCDTEVPGLYVEARATSPGQGTYYLRTKDRAKVTRHHKLGRTIDISLSEARKQARTLRAEIALGRDPHEEALARRAAPTFGELFAEYMNFARPRKRSWKSDETLYRKRLQPRFGSKRLDAISRKDLIAFHSSLLNEERLAPATADHYLKLVRRVYSYGAEIGMAKSNPAARFPLFNPDNRVNHYLNEEELRRLLTVLQTDRNRMICRLVLWLLATGCRYSEAINARWRDIDRQNRRWFIAQENSKNKRSRWAGLSDVALEILDELAPETGGHEHLFVNRSTGKVFASTKKVWDRLRNAAGLPHFRLHDCRHQFASMLANRGVNLLTIKEQLGHADVRMTASRYSHISASTLATASQVAVEAMRDAMRPPAPEAASGPAALAPLLDAANAPVAIEDEAAATATPRAGVAAVQPKAA